MNEPKDPKEIKDPEQKDDHNKNDQNKPDPKAELKKEFGADVPDSVLDRILRLSKDVDFYKSDAHKTAQQREDLKRKIEEAEEEEKRKQGKFEELYTNLKSQFDEKTKELDSFKSKLTDLEEKQKADLLNALPDGDAKTFAETLDLDRLREYVKIFKQNENKGNPPVDGGTKFNKKPDGKKHNTLKEWRKEVGL